MSYQTRTLIRSDQLLQLLSHITHDNCREDLTANYGNDNASVNVQGECLIVPGRVEVLWYSLGALLRLAYLYGYVRVTSA